MKRIIDVLVSCVLIVILIPLFVFIALLIRFTSPGSVFFVQRRIGLHGRIFNMYKFRTMIDNAERLGSGLYSYKGDPRITRFGCFLRRRSLDELPQLFNVLLGSMSLVGPRPPVTYELGPWEDYTPHMLKRFSVKPGVTGLAQVSGRNDIDWDTKIYFDNIYVDKVNRYGFIVDIHILFLTIFTVFRAEYTIEFQQNTCGQLGPISARARRACNPISDDMI